MRMKAHPNEGRKQVCGAKCNRKDLEIHDPPLR